MQIKWEFSVLGIVLLAGAAGATTVDCSTLGTLSVLITGTTGGNFCQIGDVVISGVTFAQTAGAVVTTSGVDVSPNNNPPSNANGSERGLNFNGQGQFLTGVAFTITFNGQLCFPGNMNCNNSGPQFFASPATVLTEGQAEQSVPSGSNVTTSNSITPQGQSPLTLTGGPGNSANPEVTFPGVTSFSMTLQGNGQGQLNTIEGDVEETIGPEPSTLWMMGGSLVGLAAIFGKALRRRKIVGPVL